MVYLLLSKTHKKVGVKNFEIVKIFRNKKIIQLKKLPEEKL